MPTDAEAIRREHIEAFIEHVLSVHSSSTAATRYRDLQQFFRWLLEEGEIRASPGRMRPPKKKEKQVPVVSERELRKLREACSGGTLEDRRDSAVIRTFMDTGARLEEVANLELCDLELDEQAIYVLRQRGEGANAPARSEEDQRTRPLSAGPETTILPRVLRSATVDPLPKEVEHYPDEVVHGRSLLTLTRTRTCLIGATL